MKQRGDLSKEEKQQLFQFLLLHSSDGKINRGSRTEAARKFNSSTRTVSRVWAAAWKQHKEGQAMALKSGKNNPRVHKRVHIDLELIKSMEMGHRDSQLKLATGIGCSQSTVARWLRKGMIRAHTNAIKPALTAHNKLLRLKFSLEALEIDRIRNILKFKSMQNIVHIDEKWFYMTKGTHRFYVTPDEVVPHRTCKSKTFITKIMFMCAVCRPIYADDGSLIFDGKIGIFPFTEQVPAKRGSKNRVAGTIETKAINSVTKAVIRDCLINQVCIDVTNTCESCKTPLLGVQLVSCYEHVNV